MSKVVQVSIVVLGPHIQRSGVLNQETKQKYMIYVYRIFNVLLLDMEFI